MTAFYVGQRVRIKWSVGWPELAGQVGTITQAAAWGPCMGQQEGRRGWEVAPDSWGSYRAPHKGLLGGNAFCALPDQLEPLTDSNQLVTWESMRDLWMPEHLREVA